MDKERDDVGGERTVFVNAETNHVGSTLDSISFSVRHLVIVSTIVVATIPDGFNDNFVVFTHDRLQFECESADNTTVTAPNTCPDKPDDLCNPNFYDRADMVPGQSTYVSEYSLVCESSTLKNMFVSIMFIGVLCTSPLNFITDLYGRKFVMLLSCFIQGVSVLVASFSIHHGIYGAAMFTNGLFGGLKFKAASVLIIESVPKNYRDDVGTYLMMGFTVGYAGVAGVAYLIPDWRTMLLWISAASFLATALIFFFTLESTSWLARSSKPFRGNLKKLLPGRRKEQEEIADALLTHSGQSEEEVESSGFVDSLRGLFARTVLLPKLGVMCYIWFATSILFRSFALGTSELEGSPYMNCVYSAGFDAIGFFLSLILLKIIGRRSGIAVCFFSCAFFTSICAVFSPNYFNNGEVVRWSALFSKLGFMGTHNINYIYTAEMFPLMQRSMALGVVGIVDGLGAIVSPYFIEYRATNQFVQYLCQTGLCIVAGTLAVLILPETKGLPLPITDDDLDVQDRTTLFYKRRGSSDSVSSREARNEHIVTDSSSV